MTVTARRVCCGGRGVHGRCAAGLLTASVSPPEWVTPSDALRVGAYALLLAASIRMYRGPRIRRRATRSAPSVTGSHMTCTTAWRRTSRSSPPTPSAWLVNSAPTTRWPSPPARPGRTRGKIVDLTAATPSNTEKALREVAGEFGARFNVNVTVTVDAGAFVSCHGAQERERRELVRIAREAIANAVRHGGARNVTVRLGSRRDNLLLRISDDGCGFGSASVKTAGTGLGMRTMRARAKSLGGQLVTRTRDSGGGEIEILSSKVP